MDDLKTRLLNSDWRLYPISQRAKERMVEEVLNHPTIKALTGEEKVLEAFELLGWKQSAET